ncbi:ParB/RepB/Spo0J family partition protein [Caballeronia concitans]|uniref:ParB-like partition protein n=1 Tax=Caballeronia concitans TaxID=1777133 RepID=A0A658R432_9BURK|nr:ParB/RepB/Spo0J family partition protein [Caballeronia concitans]SAL48719.1 parB-like partition protein [Caballeronia concitans]
MTSKKEEAARLAAAALDPALMPRLERRTPRIAMNRVTDFTGELEKVERDLSEAQRRLALHDGALATRKLAADSIKASKFANRIAGSFEGPSFETFKQEILSAGGNVQPIKVRRIGPNYEVVFGHRRHRACLELGLPVLAMIQEDMSDKDLFEEMSRENEQRKDLSAYELAMHYRRAIDLKLYRNWSEIAAVLGKTKSLMSRYSALAELPDAVVNAFRSPSDIQPKWAEKLRQVIDVDSAAVISAAKAIAGKSLPPKAIYEALINRSAQKFTRVNFAFGTWNETDKKATIDIDKAAIGPEKLESLRAFLASLQSESSPG